jgi:acetyl esterase/lipase
MERVGYGDAPSQFGHLRLPAAAVAPPVVALLHGGFWRAAYGLDALEPIAEHLTARGVATWNVEYRRVGEPGGGWPGTFDDVAAALDAIARDPRVDRARLVVAGFSAGGHLALWVAGARPVAAAVALAGIPDLERAAELGLNRGAIRELLGGGPGDRPDRYAAASPSRRLPIGVPQTLFHGTADEMVPFELGRAYVERAAAAGDPAELRGLDGAGHFDLVDLDGPAWPQVREVILAYAGLPAR